MSIEMAVVYCRDVNRNCVFSIESSNEIIARCVRTGGAIQSVLNDQVARCGKGRMFLMAECTE